jgi:hypothetical protein
MYRRMEDRIRQLCSEFIGEQNPDKARELSARLRTELHEYVEALRVKVSQYPTVQEWRTKSGVPSQASTVLEERP